VHAPGRELDEEQNVDPPQGDRVDGEEVARDHALCLASDELAPGNPGALAVRPIPAPIRMLRTLVAEIWIPSPISSPAIRRYPHLWFSRASRRISSRTSRLTLGRPGRRPG
jgi:hypothetical protein